MLLMGKLTISMGHLYHGELLVITRGYVNWMKQMKLDDQNTKIRSNWMTTEYK